MELEYARQIREFEPLLNARVKATPKRAEEEALDSPSLKTAEASCQK